MSDEPVRIVPRVLEFYAEHLRTPSEDQGVHYEAVSVGWRTTHWGLWLPHSGITITATADLQAATARWLSLEDATETLGVSVAPIDPQRVRLSCPGQLLMSDADSLPIASAAGRGEQGG